MLKLYAPILAVSLWLGYSIASSVAFAHGYVERFNPPLPLAWYLTTAAIVVVLSFVVSHLVTRNLITGGSGSSVFLGFSKFVSRSKYHRIAAAGYQITTTVLQMIVVALLLLILTAGFLGNQNPINNIAPTFVWVIFWVGVPIICAIIGNIWLLFNPWELLFKLAESAYGKINGGRSWSPFIQYRELWGVWPAVLLFLAFAWIENVYQGSIVPVNLSVVIAVYSVVTWTGMFIFGRQQWLRYGDPFSVLFGLLSRCSVMELVVLNQSSCGSCIEQCHSQHEKCRGCSTCFIKSDWKARGIRLRMFGSGVIHRNDTSTSETLFVLLVLSTMTLDGFLATTTWSDMRRHIIVAVPNVTAIGSLALMAALAIFYLVYESFMKLTSCFAKLTSNGRSVGRVLAITLLPIAVAYHIAHFHYFLLIQGQAVIPLISDPFGLGWDLFNTAGYRINSKVLNLNVSWVFTVVVIVVGHVIAVYTAHVIAIRDFKATATLIWGQTAILILMAGYTVVSLWVMGQPMII